MQLESARAKLTSGFTERSARQVGANRREIATIEQVEHFAFGLNLHLLPEEPRGSERFLKSKVEVVIPRLVVSISAEIAFRAKRRKREVGRREEPGQVVLLVFSAEVATETGRVRNVPVISVPVIVSSRIADERAIHVIDWTKRRTGVDRKRQAGLQYPHTTEMPAAEGVSFEGIGIVVGHQPRTIRRELQMDVEVGSNALRTEVLRLDEVG